MNATLRLMLACQKAKADGFPHFAAALAELIKRRLRLERAINVPAGKKHI